MERPTKLETIYKKENGEGFLLWQLTPVEMLMDDDFTGIYDGKL
jgi:hypothetical protein